MDDKTSWVPPWCSPLVSCSIMPWAVWTECVICSEVPWLCQELCVPPVYSRTDQSYQIQSKTPMVQQGSQLSEWTEGLRTLAMLWQWSQGSQLTTIWVDGRNEDPCNALAMAAGFTTIWVDRRNEDSWTLCQWPFQAPGRICKFQNDQACSAS